MRIRATKPEFWWSARVSSVDWADRLVFKGVEHYVDDNGVGKDDVALIVAAIFPRDMLANPRDTVAKVSGALERLNAAGLLWRYTVDGTDLLYVAFWEQSQRIDRPGKGRLPRPDGTMNYGDSEIRESVASPRETIAPGTGEQGNRGTGEQSLSCAPQAERETPAPLSLVPEPARAPEPGSDDDPDFVKFWSVYPLKKSKDGARKSWRSALKKTDASVLIAAAERYRDERAGADPKFTAHPTTWLNQGRWADEPTPAHQTGYQPYQDPDPADYYGAI